MKTGRLISQGFCLNEQPASTNPTWNTADGLPPAKPYNKQPGEALLLSRFL
jgi:hypothetical protein